MDYNIGGIIIHRLSKEESTMPKQHLRTLHRPEGDWRYKIGSDCMLLFDPNGNKFVETLNNVAERSWNLIERGRWKETSDGSIMPADVAWYIEKLHLLA